MIRRQIAAARMMGQDVWGANFHFAVVQAFCSAAMAETQKSSGRMIQFSIYDARRNLNDDNYGGTLGINRRIGNIIIAA